MQPPLYPALSAAHARERRLRLVVWVLRIAVALEFLGHGWFAFNGKPAWIPFVTLFGFAPDTALDLMRLVGILDFLLAAHVLLRPVPTLLVWMTFWGVFTASLRPLSGDSLFEFIERGPNWGAPLVLLLLTTPGSKSTLRQEGERETLSTSAPSN